MPWVYPEETITPSFYSLITFYCTPTRPHKIDRRCRFIFYKIIVVLIIIIKVAINAMTGLEGIYSKII